MSSPHGSELIVTTAALRLFGQALAGGADEVAALRVAEQFARAATALPGSDLAGRLGRAPEVVQSAFGAVGARLRALSAVAQGNADLYEQADQWRLGEGGN